eukprot:gene38512-12986_t
MSATRPAVISNASNTRWGRRRAAARDRSHGVTAARAALTFYLEQAKSAEDSVSLKAEQYDLDDGALKGEKDWINEEVRKVPDQQEKANRSWTAEARKKRAETVQQTAKAKALAAQQLDNQRKKEIGRVAVRVEVPAANMAALKSSTTSWYGRKFVESQTLRRVDTFLTFDGQDSVHDSADLEGYCKQRDGPRTSLGITLHSHTRGVEVRSLCSPNTLSRKRKVPKASAFSQADVDRIEKACCASVGVEPDGDWGGRMADAWNAKKCKGVDRTGFIYLGMMTPGAIDVRAYPRHVHGCDPCREYILKGRDVAVATQIKAALDQAGNLNKEHTDKKKKKDDADRERIQQEKKDPQAAVAADAKEVAKVKEAFFK